MDVLRSSPSQSQKQILKETNQTKISEALHLIEDFHDQYQSMCAMYEDLNEGVKKKCNNEEDEASSTSSSNSLGMESAGYFSPGSGSTSKTPSLDHLPKAAAAAATTDNQSMKSENSCHSLEDVSEVVKETLSVEPVWNTYKPEDREEEEEERGREVENLMKENGDLKDRLGEKDNKYQNLENKSSTRMKELEDRVVSLKIEIEELNDREHEQECKGKHDESAFKEKEGDVLKKLAECEKTLEGRIVQSMDRVQNVRMELDLLRSQNDEDRKKFLYERELEYLRIHNRDSEKKIKEKTEELDSLRKELQYQKEKERMQNQESETKIKEKTEELDSLRKELSYQKEKERIQNEELETAFKNKIKEVGDECEKLLEGKIVHTMDRVENIQMEVDTLRIQNVETRMKLYEKEREVESLSKQNKKSEIELKKMTKEAADSLLVLENLTEKLKEKTIEEEDLRQQVRDSTVMIGRINVENELQQATISQLNDENEKRKITISQLNDENEKKKTTISQLVGENEKQKGTISRLQDEHEKQKTTNVDLMDVNEKQKVTISQLNDENESQKATISRLNGENEKQKTANLQLNEENEKQKSRISQLKDDKEKHKSTILQLKDEKEKQKIIISQIMDETEKQKTNNSRLNGENEKQKTINVLLNDENEKQKTAISQLEKKLQAKETQFSTLESKSESVKKELLTKMKSLEHKFKCLEIDKREIEGKNDVLAVTLEQKEIQAEKQTDEAKSTFRASVKKMGEMINEFQKSSEDNIRILSRRIRVAEQLHNETRDWYKKTRDKVEQDKIDSDMNVQTIKILMTMVNETLKVTETLGLRFVECCEDFMNRVSKVSCEINSAKDWVRRKNTAMVKVKDDFDALVIDVDGKEEEVLRSRKKVLKLDTKLRELEKTVKENDEAIIVLKEEKREAIRHLCVWTDYHRSRADFLTKSLSDLLARNHRPV
ncbi:hypothetical protein LXL04_026365 [Taraxacum kok-saghyz]